MAAAGRTRATAPGFQSACSSTRPGSTACANLQHPEVRSAPVKPALAAAFYPGCGAELRCGYRAAAPLLLQVGEKDDWTTTEPCRQLAAQASGAPVTFHAYPGAVHGFDGTAPVTLRRDVPKGVRPGQGVRVVGQPAARELSRERLRSFLISEAGGCHDGPQGVCVTLAAGRLRYFRAFLP